MDSNERNVDVGEDIRGREDDFAPLAQEQDANETDARFFRNGTARPEKDDTKGHLYTGRCC